MPLPFGLAPGAALYIAAAVLVAAYVRGYSGFGFSALVVTAASLATDPLHVVPVVLLCEAGMTLAQWQGIRGEVDWRRVGALMAGAAFGVPVGLWALAGAGEAAARAAIALFVLAMCGALLAGWRLTRPQGGPAHGAAGVVSGLANAAAVGGLPVAVFLTAQAIPAATFRATMVVYLAALDIWTFPLMAWRGLVDTDTFLAAGLALPFIAVGLALGGRRFLKASPTEFRRFAILLLATLACLALAKSLI